MIDVAEEDPPHSRRPAKDPPEGWTKEVEEDEEGPSDAEAAAQQRERLAEFFNRPGEFSLTRPARPVTALQVEINDEGTKMMAGVVEGVVIAMAAFQSPPFGERSGERWTCDFSLHWLDVRASRHFYWLNRDLALATWSQSLW